MPSKQSIAVLVILLAFAIPTHAKPPNVLLIIGDDQAWTDYGFMGHKHIRTPHLDKLASQGLVFKRGYVPSSLCRPSLATIITGLYPHQHKITSNDPPAVISTAKSPKAKVSSDVIKQRSEMVSLFEQTPTLPKLLEKQGYVSLQVGKWWEGNACRCGGFTEGMTHGDPAKGGRHGDKGLEIGRQGLQPVFDFMEQAKKNSKPFFVWYAPMLPHAPHNPPERLLDKYSSRTPSIHVARYWAMCEWFDETIGDLLGELEKNGQADDTLIIYLHDNGWIQDPDAPRYAPKSKQSPYDGGLRTPIIVKWTGRVQPGTSDALVSSIDVAPTILAAVGGKAQPNMPGGNLISGEGVANRKTIFGEVFEHTAIDITKPAANLKYRWIVDGEWKLIVPHSPNVGLGEIELYDVRNDPHETTNRARERSDKVGQLEEKLDAWWSPKEGVGSTIGK
jgi:uncharacterized sulfatase